MYSLGEVIRRRLESQSERPMTRFLSEDGGSREIRGSELIVMASQVMAEIDARALPDRSLVGIALYSSPALHAAWLGCLWSRRIPTMVAPPSPRMEPQKYANGLAGIVGHLRLKALIVDATAANALAGRVPPDLELIQLGDLAGDMPACPVRSFPPDEVTVVQHSSGTTGAQKAIALTSAQIMAHHAAYADRIDLTERDSVVSWLPLYHDMGFVTCFLQPLIAGLELTEMSPFAWANRPADLLRAIDRCKPTLCWMPNFAFALMAEPRVLRGIDDLDLSSVRARTNCSEPVMASSVDSFVAALGRFGVKRESVLASYAMAENVFAVTQSVPGKNRHIHVERAALQRNHLARIAAPTENDTITLVSNGTRLSTTEVEVRDGEGKPVAEGRIGEFHLRGTHRFEGYYQRPDLTAQSIDANGWYATGDLGFVLHEHVYVTGRKKDLIIIRGRNYHAHDIELAIGALDGVKSGRVVAFSLPDEALGTERLIVLAEAEAGYEERHGVLVLQIRNQIAQNFDTTASDVRIVPERWLVKATAGKMARNDNRRKYLETLAQKGVHV